MQMAGTIAYTAHWGIMAVMAAFTASITDPLNWKLTVFNEETLKTQNETLNTQNRQYGIQQIKVGVIKVACKFPQSYC